MNSIIIYDNAGYIFSLMSGSIVEPQGGVQFLKVVIPEGKQIKSGIGVDVSVTPHQAILEDIPKTDIDKLKERQDATENALLDLLLGGM